MPETSNIGPRFGPHWDSEAVCFRVAAPNAERVELCLFDPAGTVEQERRDLALDSPSEGPSGIAGTWARTDSDLAPGQLYGYRVHGPYEPQAGHRFDPSKLLVDPAAPALTGRVHWDPRLCPTESMPQEPKVFDSAAFVPRSRVVDLSYDWAGDERPRTPWEATVVYECHVRGATLEHPDIPPAVRGTYLGLAHPAFVEHLLRLGVTAIELMPVHHFTPERHLASTGRVNYWGYSPLAFYAPHAGYATGDDGRQVEEFRRMVRALHDAGIEVLIDVVVNHTCEGDALGPTLSLRGIDNKAYYRTNADSGDYIDYTGCGNTLNTGTPIVDAFLLDCLRHWAREFRIDGFRFDLAPVVGRVGSDFDPSAPLLQAIADDPLLGSLKCIAEPWDLGPDGYKLGHFPKPWREWNDRFRDTARAFWREDDGQAEELETRLLGSPDLFDGDRDRSLNYIVAHDGFTLADLVTYEQRHNADNGEDNRDGHRHNLSRNWGVEGSADDPEILALRRQTVRNLLATLMLAEGPVMISHGDEVGRTQRGNNNAYCQDNRLTWIDWTGRTAEDNAAGGDLTSFIAELTTLRNALLEDRQSNRWEAYAVPDRPDGLSCVGSPRRTMLLALWNGPKALEMALPTPATDAEWKLRWTSSIASGLALDERSPSADHALPHAWVRLPARSVNLFESTRAISAESRSQPSK